MRALIEQFVNENGNTVAIHLMEGDGKIKLHYSSSSLVLDHVWTVAEARTLRNMLEDILTKPIR